MRKLLVILVCLTTILVAAGVAMADDPNGDIQRARDLLAQADAILAAEQAKPPAVVTETITQTVTQAVTATPTTTTVPATTTTPPPTITTPAPPPSGFPTRQEVLAGAQVAPASGKMNLIQGRWDFRGWSWTTSERFPITTAGRDSGIVGGTYLGTFDRSLDWDAMHSGAVLLQRGGGYLVSYDLRAENAPDFYRPRPEIDGNLASQQASRFLLDGCYGVYIRDDAVENDQELTGTVNDCLFDGIHMGVSIGQSNTNPAAVTTVTNSIFIFKPMPHIGAPDGMGHAAFFKQLGAGRVVLRNVAICYTEPDVRGNLERMGRWMPGTYENVTVVLGAGWTDAQAAQFPPVPSGVTVSRDWQGWCINAAAAWRAAHGY